MIQVKHIVGTRAFDELSAEWDTLAATGITDTPFQTLAYQKSWFTHLGTGELHTITVRDDDHLIGIGCFNLRDQTVFFNASKEESDYLDIIAAEEHAAIVWQAVFDCLAGPQVGQWQTLDLYNIPAESISRNIIPTLATSRGFSFADELAEVCPTIALPDSFEAYLAGLDKKQRHEIKRKMRRAKGAEAVLQIISAEDDLTAEVDAFLDLLQKSTPAKRAWYSEPRAALFHDVAQAAQDAGTLQLMFIEVDERKAAGLFNFAYKGRTWVYNSGLNPDVFGRLSLGVTLSSLAIQTAIELGHSEFDFLRGDEAYKYRFGAVNREIYRLQVAR